MFYGAPVTGPMEIPQEYPSPYRPEGKELNELPEIKDTSTQTIRLEGTLAKRLPSMPGGALENLYATGTRQRAAAEYANDMRSSWGISRGIDRDNRSKARAKAQAYDRQIKNSGSQGVRTRRKIQGNTQRMEKSTILRNARDYLGMGTDLYRET